MWKVCRLIVFPCGKYIRHVRENSVDIEKSKESQWEDKPNTSALLTTLLELLKKKEPELCSPALRRLETYRERHRNQ